MDDTATRLQVESGTRESIYRRYAIMEEAMLKEGFEMLRMREAMRWTIPSPPLVALGGFCRTIV